MEEPTYPPTVARLVAPRVALASCVRAWVVRSTVGCAPLAAPQRLNRFPATPFCTITWMFEGSAQLVVPAVDDPAIDTWLRPGQALFCGPQSRPFVTSNPGPVHVMTVMLFADALHRLTGLDMAAQLDRMAPLGEVLDTWWQDLSASVLAAVTDEERIAVFETGLERRWRGVRADGALVHARDWVQALAVRAAAAGMGRSARMAERRVRAWAGHPLRTLRRLDRIERSMVAARTASQAEQGRVSLAEVAAAGGFADQAHLSREARAIAGTSPAELLRLAQTDESYWLYRIWL
ncbi:helix-turn-helix domain-containing protein [Massilia sp. YMA4]|uniref:Helix-turn-helix domain-containing protein n=1 Tax=[Empedobacter] haloabium TaxID=592317 RepID=A0ABZ1URY4_9BURK|nr:helix-turn-helix domain-containing protein [Massilia sp. YMA4]AXA91243.1 AraC family transcriptional regulator [Massilia sp. YMA4]